LDLFLLRLGLIRFKGANVKLRSIHQFIVGLLKEIKHELQQWAKAIVVLDACNILLLNRERLLYEN